MKYMIVALLLQLSAMAWAAEPGLPDLKLSNLKAGTVKVTAPAPARQAGEGRFAVAGNGPLLAEFSADFDYRSNGHVFFKYSLANLRFYRLTGWPRHMLVQVADHTLPEFHNFAVFALSGDTGYKRLYLYDAETAAGKYTALTVPDAVCALDPACAKLNAARKTEEAAQLGNIRAWEAGQFAAVKPELLRMVAAHYDSEKFAKLGAGELAAAKQRFAAILEAAQAGTDGKAALLAANDKEWRKEYCGASSVELMGWMQGAAPEEQDRIVLRCGFVQDAAWLIKKNYEALAVEKRHAACAGDGVAAEDRAYCNDYSAWLKVYSRVTGAIELRPSNGLLAI